MVSCCGVLLVLALAFAVAVEPNITSPDQLHRRPRRKVVVEVVVVEVVVVVVAVVTVVVYLVLLLLVRIAIISF